MVEIQERQVKLLRNSSNKEKEKNSKNKAEIEKKDEKRELGFASYFYRVH